MAQQNDKPDIRYIYIQRPPPDVQPEHVSRLLEPLGWYSSRDRATGRLVIYQYRYADKDENLPPIERLIISENLPPIERLFIA